MLGCLYISVITPFLREGYKCVTSLKTGRLIGRTQFANFPRSSLTRKLIVSVKDLISDDWNCTSSEFLYKV